MSILRTLNTGATGLTANGDALGVVGDNIANGNTIGFKRSRANFEDMVANAGRSDMLQIGAGSRVGDVQQMFNQGALVSTENPTDLALAGEGFFVVQGNAAGVDGTFFTRAGQFHLDKAGYMVNDQNLKLQGYQADDNGNITGSVGNIRVGPTALPATPTGNIALAVNLNSNSDVAAPWDATRPASTSNFSTSTTIYDSLGNGHQATVYFSKTTTGWDWNAMVDPDELPTSANPVVANGTLTFTTNGALESETTPNDPAPFTIDFLGATPGQEVRFDFGTNTTTDAGSGLDGTTSFASASTTNGISQDGYAAGSVSGVAVNETGVITGVFSNGQRRTLGQVVVAAFRSQDGLARSGGNLWSRTEESGEALIGAAGTAGRGTVSSATLEQSNVDMGREFVDLIKFQRGFQASSKVIQTADELYGELVNLRR
jgi:flagellar hook protein FlgE